MEYSMLQGLGMDAAQCGFLIGVRPIIEYLATPFWHGMSDRWVSCQCHPATPFWHGMSDRWVSCCLVPMPFWHGMSDRECSPMPSWHGMSETIDECPTYVFLASDDKQLSVLPMTFWHGLTNRWVSCQCHSGTGWQTDECPASAIMARDVR